MKKKLPDKFAFEVIVDGKSMGWLYQRNSVEKKKTKNEIKRLSGLAGVEIKTCIVSQ